MQNGTSEDRYMCEGPLIMMTLIDRTSKKKDLKKKFKDFFLIKKKWGGVRLLEHVR